MNYFELFELSQLASTDSRLPLSSGISSSEMLLSVSTSLLQLVVIIRNYIKESPSCWLANYDVSLERTAESHLILSQMCVSRSSLSNIRVSQIASILFDWHAFQLSRLIFTTPFIATERR